MTNQILDNNYKCTESRGLLFKPTEASAKNRTYDANDFQVLRNYGFVDRTVQVWLDNITFGFSSTSTSTPSGSFMAPVAATNDWDYSWLGFLGIDARPTNFSEQGGQENPKFSLLEVMKDAKYIPSKSWGYMAGSVNRETLPNMIIFADVANKKKAG
jgi:hypothetical protein